MSSKDEVIPGGIEVSYTLKFVDYQKLKTSISHRRRFSARVTVQVVKRRGTRILEEFVAYFHKDKKKWQVLWRGNTLVMQDLRSRATAALNKHFPPNGVVKSTESAAA